LRVILRAAVFGVRAVLRELASRQDVVQSSGQTVAEFASQSLE
jgi:hypothetical protein